jgi:hypothetical protein
MSQGIGKSKGRIIPRTIRATSPLRANRRRGYQRPNGQLQTAILMDGLLYREIVQLADSSDTSVCQKIRELLEARPAKNVSVCQGRVSNPHGIAPKGF